MWGAIFFLVFIAVVFTLIGAAWGDLGSEKFKTVIWLFWANALKSGTIKIGLIVILLVVVVDMYYLSPTSMQIANSPKAKVMQIKGVADSVSVMKDGTVYTNFRFYKPNSTDTEFELKTTRNTQEVTSGQSVTMYVIPE